MILKLFSSGQFDPMETLIITLVLNLLLHPFRPDKCLIIFAYNKYQVIPRLPGRRLSISIPLYIHKSLSLFSLG